MSLDSNIKNLFDHFDLNRDGSMSFEELKILFAVLQDLNKDLKVNPEVVKAYFQAADKNKDGKLSYEELLTILTQSFTPQDEKTDNLRKHFYSYDMNNNGYLSQSEFDNFARSSYTYMNDPRFKYNDNVSQLLFKEVDTSGDGRITFDEFYLFVTGILKKK